MELKIFEPANVQIICELQICKNLPMYESGLKEGNGGKGKGKVKGKEESDKVKIYYSLFTGRQASQISLPF